MAPRQNQDESLILFGETYIRGQQIPQGIIALCKRVPNETSTFNEITAKAMVDEWQRLFHSIDWVDMPIGNGMLIGFWHKDKMLRVLQRLGVNKYSTFLLFYPSKK